MAAWQSADPKIQTALHRRQTALSFGTTFSQLQIYFFVAKSAQSTHATGQINS